MSWHTFCLSKDVTSVCSQTVNSVQKSACDCACTSVQCIEEILDYITPQNILVVSSKNQNIILSIINFYFHYKFLLPRQ
jgi:hypothetical protein